MPRWSASSRVLDPSRLEKLPGPNKVLSGPPLGDLGSQQHGRCAPVPNMLRTCV